MEPWAVKMRAETVPMLNMFVGLGVEADLSSLPESTTFPLKEKITVDNITYEALGINNYAGFAGYAPEGCTAVTTILMGDSYDFWKQCREDGTYEAEKQKVAEAVIRVLEQKYPSVAGKVTVWDVRNPADLRALSRLLQGQLDVGHERKGRGMCSIRASLRAFRISILRVSG